VCECSAAVRTEVDLDRRLCWRPCPLVQRYIDLFLEHLTAVGGTVVDIGSGASRDVAFVGARLARCAAEVERGVAVALLSLDYLPKLVASFDLVAASASLQPVHLGQLLDLPTPLTLPTLTAAAPATCIAMANLTDDETQQRLPSLLCSTSPSLAPSLIIQIRFLSRSLFPTLRQLASHGHHPCLIAIETFRDGAQAFGSPKSSKFLLDDGELAREFGPGHGFAIIAFEDTVTLSDGRPAQRIVAGFPADHWAHHATTVDTSTSPPVA